MTKAIQEWAKAPDALGILKWEDIEANARAFSVRWLGEAREMSEAQTFWNEFYQIFGVDRRASGITHEKPVKDSAAKGRKRTKRIDTFFPGKVLSEHKSTGKSLDDALSQALSYCKDLPPHDRPSVVVVCDFAQFVVLLEGIRYEFSLLELSDNIKLFGVIAGRPATARESEESVDQQTARVMADVHNSLIRSGYTDQTKVGTLLVRLAYCMFAEDAGVFPSESFTEFIQQRTSTDGSDIGIHLNRLFTVLNTPYSERPQNTPDYLKAFPYVNGGMFSGDIGFFEFTSDLRDKILAAARADWRGVSPVVFGSLFQEVMDAHGKAERRQLGAHYTSEANIMKVIRPLFLDEWTEKVEQAIASKNVSNQKNTWNKLRNLTFLDPACGCGNFLIVTFRELRRLEHKLVKELGRKKNEISISALNFKGLEISEFPAKVAEAALWMMEQLMELEGARTLEVADSPHLPLPKEKVIRVCDALAVEWPNVDYIMGNPPFAGKTQRSIEQRISLGLVIGKKATMLDFVSGWFVRAASSISEGNGIKAAFVANSSIAQGSQRKELSDLIKARSLGVSYTSSFKWSNEARGKQAGVYCVIGSISANEDIGFVVSKESKPLSKEAPVLEIGSFPLDGGGLILSRAERDALIEKFPVASEWVRPFASGEDLVKSKERFCLWLKDVSPSVLSKVPFVVDRLKRVRAFRASSAEASTRKKADTPYEFVRGINPRQGARLLIPKVTASSREYIPLGFLDESYIIAAPSPYISSAELFCFSIIISACHMSWMRETTSRMGDGYRYSTKTTYNTFVWPELTEQQKEKLNQLGQAILDARANHPDCTLADLYDPLTMPADLRKAHNANDKYVDSLYGLKDATEETRLAELMKRYQEVVVEEEKGR